jgi:hypothetical protein
MPSLIAAFGGDEKFDAWGRDQHLPDFVLEHPIGVGDPLAQMHELEPRLNEVGLFIAAEITGQTTASGPRTSDRVSAPSRGNEGLVFGFEAFAAPETPFGAMPDVRAIATFDAVRPVLDEPKAIGSASAFRAAEKPPRSATLNLVCAKPISFRLWPNWMIVCGASSCTAPVARSRGIFTHRNSSKNLR